MAKAAAAIRKAQTTHSWGILLGMMGIPVLALFSKVYPHYETIWQVLMGICGLVIIRSTIGYLFPGLGPVDKKPGQAVTQSR